MYLEYLSSTFSEFNLTQNQIFENVNYYTLREKYGKYSFLNIIYKKVPDLSIYGEKINLPEPLVKLYQEFNGCSLFRKLNASISLFGFVDDKRLLNRLGGLEHEVPYNILDMNKETANIYGKLPESLLRFGYYGCKGEGIFYDLETNKIVVISQEDQSDIRYWESLDSWFFSEIDRIKKLFDKDGYLFGSFEDSSPMTSKYA